jgi:hypothetical protein
MKLTDDVKAQIDALDYFHLLKGWRYAPAGDPMFQDESGDYWGERMRHFRTQPGGQEIAVAASKRLG